MDPILLFVLKWYCVIAINNLVACFVMMYAHKKNLIARTLGWPDVWWTIGLTVAGPVGTGAIIFAIIQLLRDMKEKKEAKKKFDNEGGLI